MPGKPILLHVSNAPARDDTRRGADWLLALAALSWVEGHAHCGGLIPGPGGVLACPCGDRRLVFEIGEPVPGSEAAA